MVLFNVKFCHILVIISEFDIKSNRFLHSFIFWISHYLIVGLKVFEIKFEIFFPKKSLQNWQKNAIFSGTIGDHIFASWTQCKKPHLSRSPSFRNTFFWMTPYLSARTSSFFCAFFFTFMENLLNIPDIFHDHEFT